jgi:hypothetical protein
MIRMGISGVDWSGLISLASSSLVPWGELFKALDLEKKRVRCG